jgi:hypothetical protein
MTAATMQAAMKTRMGESLKTRMGKTNLAELYRSQATSLPAPHPI